jgi:diphosphomevalonate decarboxylase
MSRFPEIAHFVVVVSAGEKKVSSSEAHLRVKTSPLWEGRVERVTDRFEKTRAAIEAGDVAAVSKLAWGEMWEMHSLFHTSDDPFTYWEPQTIEALQFFGEFLGSQNPVGCPPIVTLDAGPNVHVLVPAAERLAWRERLVAKFGQGRLLEDSQGTGAEVMEE